MTPLMKEDLYGYVYVCVPVYSLLHQAMCGGDGPGRRCVESPGLSHCSLSAHGFPPNCLALVTQPLYMYTQTQLTTHCDL